MAYAVGRATKPAAFVKLEHWLAPRDPDLMLERLDISLAALEDPDPRAWLERAGDLELGEQQVDHFLGDWLGGGYWAAEAATDRQEAFRRGLVDALRAAREHHRPCTFVWVTHEAFDPGTFEVTHVVGPHDVVVVFLTAAPQKQTAS